MRFWRPTLLLDLTSGISYPQTQTATNEECSQAQVLSVKGHWTATSGNSLRSLAKGGCLSAREIVNLAKDAESGEITIIYHSGDIPPQTIQCKSRAQCNDAYQVEDVSSKPTADWWHILTQLLRRERPRQRPGILHGSLMLAPEVLCSDEGKIDFEPFGGRGAQHQLEFRKAVLTPLLVTADGDIDSGKSWSVDFSGKANHLIARPAVYQMEAVKADGKTGGSTIVLIAPASSCASLSTSFHEEAVNYTLKWSADTPADAIFTFQSAYLEYLVAETPKSVGKK